MFFQQSDVTFFMRALQDIIFLQVSYSIPFSINVFLKELQVLLHDKHENLSTLAAICITICDRKTESPSALPRSLFQGEAYGKNEKPI